MTIWFLLLALLGASLLLGSWGHPVLATVLIFAIAAFKAWLVAAYYMRLKFEPLYVTGILLAGVVFMVILYVALVPDIVFVYGRP